MRIKVKYDETLAKETTTTVDDDELLKWLNSDQEAPYETLAEYRTAVGESAFGGDLQQYLEDERIPSEWLPPATDPNIHAFNQEIVAAEVVE